MNENILHSLRENTRKSNIKLNVDDDNLNDFDIYDLNQGKYLFFQHTVLQRIEIFAVFFCLVVIMKCYGTRSAD